MAVEQATGHRGQQKQRQHPRSHSRSRATIKSR